MTSLHTKFVVLLTAVEAFQHFRTRKVPVGALLELGIAGIPGSLVACFVAFGAVEVAVLIETVDEELKLFEGLEAGFAEAIGGTAGGGDDA